MPSTKANSHDSMRKDVLVVIGAGGIGQAIARRQGAGKIVLFADFNEQTLAATGYTATT